MDINHHPLPSDYNIFLLAGDPSWGLEEMEEVVKEAKDINADGVLLDIEGDYAALSDNVQALSLSLPVYVCIPYWLEDELQEQIIKSVDGIVVIEGAKASAIIYSITETAKANRLNTFRYMEYLLTELMEHLDDTDRSFLDNLLPWSETLPDICRSSQQ